MKQIDEFNELPGIHSQIKIKKVLDELMNDASGKHAFVLHHEYAKQLKGISRRKLEIAKADLEYFIDIHKNSLVMVNAMYVVFSLLLFLIIMDYMNITIVSSQQKFWITLFVSMMFLIIKYCFYSQIERKNKGLHVIKIAIANLNK